MHAIVVLLGASALAWRAGARDEARDIALAVTGGGLVAGAGLLATAAGPGPIHAETSKDGYLRRAGLDRELVDAYRERFRLRAARYVQWISVPLAVAGTADAGGFLQRFLISWLVVIAIGVPVGYVTGWLPPDRLVTFGFAVPIGAALGLRWLYRRLDQRPWLARVLVVVLAGWMIVGALLAWGRQKPFISPHEAGLAREASILSFYAPEGSPAVFIVDDPDATATFLGARAANILRAAADGGRAADIYVFVGTISDYFAGKPTVRGDPEYDSLSRLTLADIPQDPGSPRLRSRAVLSRGGSRCRSSTHRTRAGRVGLRELARDRCGGREPPAGIRTIVSVGHRFRDDRDLAPAQRARSRLCAGVLR